MVSLKFITSNKTKWMIIKEGDVIIAVKHKGQLFEDDQSFAEKLIEEA